MITHKELCKWDTEVLLTKTKAEVLAQQFSHSENMAKYYMHLVQVADAQHSIMQRLIRQSAANEVIQTHANNKSA